MIELEVFNTFLYANIRKNPKAASGADSILWQRQPERAGETGGVILQHNTDAVGGFIQRDSFFHDETLHKHGAETIVSQIERNGPELLRLLF